ncbi:hypothetical protein ACGF5F_32715 [Streptomyces sp. NPDC047821]
MGSERVSRFVGGTKIVREALRGDDEPGECGQPERDRQREGDVAPT